MKKNKFSELQQANAKIMQNKVATKKVVVRDETLSNYVIDKPG